MGALDLALDAVAATGWKAFAVRPDKTPYRGTHSFLDATDDRDELRLMFDRRPGSLPALAVPAGRVVVDLDSATAGDGLDLPPTAWQATRRGRHLFYIGDARPAVAVATGVDLRGHGSYVVLYGRWWETGALAQAPAWVEAHRERAPLDLGSEECEVFAEGERDEALTRACGQMVNIGMTANERLAALLVMNRDRCEPPLHRRQVEKIVRSSLTWERQAMPRITMVKRRGWKRWESRS
ncbi:MAG TPA: bifunctional DNA primase/polymerase [Vicinamibacterales bacterium]|nr:bifunctional DNA primase/polymerase [Vicinamibacterales bacterium]